MISKQQTINYLWLDYSLHRLNDAEMPTHILYCVKQHLPLDGIYFNLD
jgi:hypothetical protein